VLTYQLDYDATFLLAAYREVEVDPWSSCYAGKAVSCHNWRRLALPLCDSAMVGVCSGDLEFRGEWRGVCFEAIVAWSTIASSIECRPVEWSVHEQLAHKTSWMFVGSNSTAPADSTNHQRWVPERDSINWRGSTQQYRHHREGLPVILGLRIVLADGTGTISSWTWDYSHPTVGLHPHSFLPYMVFKSSRWKGRRVPGKEFSINPPPLFPSSSSFSSSYPSTIVIIILQ